MNINAILEMSIAYPTLPNPT